VFQLVIEANATGARFVWIEVNPSGGVPGSGRRYAEFVQPMPTASFLFASGGGFTYQLAAGDTLLAVAFQTSGSSLNVGLSGNQVSELSITRLSE
jgi:hypothetical protein